MIRRSLSGSSGSRRSSTITASRAGGSYWSPSGADWLERLELPEAARLQIEVALTMIDAVNAQLRPLDQELRAFARRQPGYRAPMAHYEIAEITSVAILAELGEEALQPA